MADSEFIDAYERATATPKQPRRESRPEKADSQGVARPSSPAQALSRSVGIPANDANGGRHAV